MARTVPNKGYGEGGIYDAESVGKIPAGSRSTQAQNAANEFADAERAASNSAPTINSQKTSSVSDEAEQGGAGAAPLYTRSVGKGRKVDPNDPSGARPKFSRRSTKGARGGGKSSKKPVLVVFGVTGIFGLFFGAMSSLLPIHAIENLMGLKNSMNTMADRRVTRLVRKTIGRENTDAWNTWRSRNKMSPRQINRLNRGLESEGMRFDLDAEGKVVLSTARNTDGTIARTDTGELNWRATAVDDVEFASLMRDFPDVRTGFNRGSRVMKGPIAGWFGTASDIWLRTKKMVRNILKDFSSSEADGDPTRAVQARAAAAEEGAAMRSAALDTESKSTEPDSETGKPPDKFTPDERHLADRQIDTARATIEADIRARAEKISGAAGISYAVTCGVLLAVAGASAVLAADQMARGLQVIGTYLESGQKTKAGDGDDSYHAFGEMLTTPTVTTYVDSKGDTVEAHGGAKVSAVESNGLLQPLTGSTFSAEDDPSAVKYHAEKAVGFISLSLGAVTGCTAAHLVSSMIGLAAEVVSTIIMFIPGIGQAFALGKFLFGIGTSLLLQTAVSAALPAVVGALATLFVTKLATDALGEDFGNMLGSLSGKYMSGMHQGNGGVVATKGRAYAYYRETQDVLAEQAELDRLDRSPFDVTNKNTFLGSLAYKLSGFAASGGSLFGQVSSLASLAQSSRLPWAFSASAADSLAFEESLGNCPQLSQIANGLINPEDIEADAANRENPNKVNDVACDLFGHPMRSNDPTMFESDPEEVFWKVATTCEGRTCSFEYTRGPDDQEVFEQQVALAGRTVSDVLYRECRERDETLDYQPCIKWEYFTMDITENSNGMEIIDPDSELMKMYKYGVQRNTDPGVQDVNIMMAEDNSGPSWLGAIPVIGEVQELISAKNNEDAIREGWVDGRNFCNGCTPEWDTKFKYLDQYIVDTNLYEGMGALSENPLVTAWTTHIAPTLDMSPEGVLARNMGMPKVWVVDQIAFLNDLQAAPREVDTLIASAPNIYTEYYHGATNDRLVIPATEDPCAILESAQECTVLAGVELRRRFNAEATA